MAFLSVSRIKACLVTRKKKRRKKNEEKPIKKLIKCCMTILQMNDIHISGEYYHWAT